MASAASPGGADASQSASLSQSQPLSPHAPHDGNEALASDRSTSRRSRNQKKINGFSTYIPQRPVMPISTPVLNTLYGVRELLIMIKNLPRAGKTGDDRFMHGSTRYAIVLH